MPAEPQPTLLLGDVRSVALRASELSSPTHPIECVIEGTSGSCMILPVSASAAKAWAELLVIKAWPEPPKK